MHLPTLTIPYNQILSERLKRIGNHSSITIRILWKTKSENDDQNLKNCASSINCEIYISGISYS